MKILIQLLLCVFLIHPPANAQDINTSFYGYVKVDVAYDSHLSSHGNYIMYVQPQNTSGSPHTLNFTARQSRLGLNLTRNQTKGNVEIDFYGGGTENKNSIALRKAFVDIPVGTAILRAGQASDIISPLTPNTLNYGAGYGAGNIGYRRPQIAILIKNQPYSFALGITRNISSDLNNDTIVDGEASGLPSIQSRTGLQFSRFALGVSAHYGKLEAPGASQEDYATWSVNADAVINFNPQFTLKGEAYTGVNTAVYQGAIANHDCVNELQSQGGWINLTYDIKGPLAFSFGGGFDDLCEEEKFYLANLPDTRAQNTFGFGLITYAISPDTILGFEISHWQTTYRNPSPDNRTESKNLRLQWSVQSNF